MIQDFTFLLNVLASPQGCGKFLPCQLSHGASSRFFDTRIYEAAHQFGNSFNETDRGFDIPYMYEYDATPYTL